jgi:hypothetical protein
VVNCGVGDLPGGDEQAHGPAVAVGSGMNPGGEPAAGTAESFIGRISYGRLAFPGTVGRRRAVPAAC